MEYTKGTFTTTRSEKKRDLKRIMKIKRRIEKNIPGCILHVGERTEWQKEYRIPFDLAGDSIFEEHFRLVRDAGGRLFGIESVEGTNYSIRVTKEQSIFRNWSWIEMILLLFCIGCIIGCVTLFYNLISQITK